MDGQVEEVRDAGVGDHPWMLFIVSTRSIHCSSYGTMVGPPRNSRISGWARIHCIVSISARAASGRSANWLCAPCASTRCTSRRLLSSGNASASTVLSSRSL